MDYIIIRHRRLPGGGITDMRIMDVNLVKNADNDVHALETLRDQRPPQYEAHGWDIQPVWDPIDASAVVEGATS